MMKSRILGAWLILVLPLVAAAQMEPLAPASGFDLGLGLVVDMEYHDFLEDQYPDYDTSGGYGWLDLHMGYDIPLSDNLYVSPTVALWVNFVVVDGGDGDSFANTIVLPSLRCRYLFGSRPSAYIAGEVNYGVPNTGSDRFDFDEGDIGYGGFVGYNTENNWRMEIGYSQAPVTVEYGEEIDFGGVVIRFTATL